MQRTNEALLAIATKAKIPSPHTGLTLTRGPRRRALRERYTLRQAAALLGVSIVRVHEAAKFLGFACLAQACPRMSGVELERLFRHFTLRADVFDC